MNNHIEYLAFKGIEKKERILFKSFMNLAKNDLAYQIVVLSASDAENQTPGIVIIDESYSKDEKDDFANAQSIVVGNDLQKQSDSYIVRPAQWSDFKTALSKLTIVGVDGPLEERVLPDDVDLEVEEEESNSEITEYASVSEIEEEEGLKM